MGSLNSSQNSETVGVFTKQTSDSDTRTLGCILLTKTCFLFPYGFYLLGFDGMIQN